MNVIENEWEKDECMQCAEYDDEYDSFEACLYDVRIDVCEGADAEQCRYGSLQYGPAKCAQCADQSLTWCAEYKLKLMMMWLYWMKGKFLDKTKFCHSQFR